MQRSADGTRKWFEILILWKPLSIFFADEIILIHHDKISAVTNTTSLLGMSHFHLSWVLPILMKVSKELKYNVLTEDGCLNLAFNSVETLFPQIAAVLVSGICSQSRNSGCHQWKLWCLQKLLPVAGGAVPCLYTVIPQPRWAVWQPQEWMFPDHTGVISWAVLALDSLCCAQAAPAHQHQGWDCWAPWQEPWAISWWQELSVVVAQSQNKSLSPLSSLTSEVLEKDC